MDIKLPQSKIDMSLVSIGHALAAGHRPNMQLERLPSFFLYSHEGEIETQPLIGSFLEVNQVVS